jgi:ribonuclease HII
VDSSSAARSGRSKETAHRANAASKNARKAKPRATRRFERALEERGVSLIAGVDEVGRGCLAGPVLAAAVILPNDRSRLRCIVGVQDSKVLSVADRERLYEQILKIAISHGVGLCSHRFIDRYGIAPASRIAMMKAVGRLNIWPEHLLVDAVRLPLLDVPQSAIIDGDALSLTIAAASIIAKVTRDRMMVAAGVKYPEYGFESHKGYGTRQHHDALISVGPSTIHRLTFRPTFASCSIGELMDPTRRSDLVAEAARRDEPSSEAAVSLRSEGRVNVIEPVRYHATSTIPV